MFCPICGKQLGEDARFCSYCGASITAAKKKICPKCKKEMEEGMLFCDQCGTRLDAYETASPAKEEIKAPPKPETPQENRTRSGRLLKKLNMISWYEGEKKVGIAKASGNMMIYDDKIVFHKTFGSSAKNMLGLVGMISSAKDAKKDPDVVFGWSDILGAENAKYMGAMPAMIVEIWDKQKLEYAPNTFAGTFNEKDIREAVDLINRYCK